MQTTDSLDVGVYPRQISVAPSNTMAILVARGNGKAKVPGALKQPTLIQRINTHGMHPSTFAIGPTGRIVIAGNQSPVVVKATPMSSFKFSTWHTSLSGKSQ